MDLNHLHLHVGDLAASRTFWERYFGFRERVVHGKILFLTNDAGFDLALAPDDRKDELPPWFHFGFRLPAPDDVRALHRSMVEGGTNPGELGDEPDMVWFRCQDPDGHAVEVYWE